MAILAFYDSEKYNGSDLPDADLVYYPEDIRNCLPVNCIGAKS